MVFNIGAFAGGVVTTAQGRSVSGISMSVDESVRYFEELGLIDDAGESNIDEEILTTSMVDVSAAPVCTGCGDIASALVSCTRKECPNRYCVEKGHHLPCIVPDTMQIVTHTFVCPPCHLKARNNLPYLLTNYSGGYATEKLNLDPLAVAILVLGSMSTNYISTLLLCHLQEIFRAIRPLLNTVVLPLAPGQSVVQKLKPRVRSILNFIRTQKDNARFLLLVDTHSDIHTGRLAYSKAPKGQLLVCPADDLITQFISPEVISAVAQLHALKAVILLTCGTAYTNEKHLKAITGLVTSHVFDFVLGFTGPNVVPRMVGLEIISAIEQVFIYGEDIFTGILKAFSSNCRLLTNTPVNVIYYDKKGLLQCRSIVYSASHARLWGLNHRCIDPNCPAGSMRGTVGRAPNHGWGRIECVSCKYRSQYHERPDFIHETSVPFVFWHDFPLPASAHDYIIMKEVPLPSS